MRIFAVQPLTKDKTAAAIINIQSAGTYLKRQSAGWIKLNHTDTKEKKFFLIYKEIQRNRVQSHIGLTASSSMVKYLCISSYIRKPFLIPIWLCTRSHLNFLIQYMGKFFFLFINAFGTFFICAWFLFRESKISKKIYKLLIIVILWFTAKKNKHVRYVKCQGTQFGSWIFL